jgi:uncharacterized membrane protein (UPF0127 family)
MFAITNVTSGIIIADRAQMATRLLARAVGLLSRSHLATGEALIFPRCNAIHTCGMRFAIDVLFLRTVQGSRLKVQGEDRNNNSLEPRTLNLEPILGTVVRAAEQVKPFRLLSARGADTVIELPAGTISRTCTQIGHQIAACSI